MNVLILFLSLCLGVGAFWPFDEEEEEPEWNNVKVKWAINIFSSYAFAPLPLTEAEAIKKGFTKISECDEKYPWRGARYAKDGELALVILYDVTGYIAGIQTSIPHSNPNGYPRQALQPPFLPDGDRFAITAYFTDPAKICSTGRSASQVAAEGIGSNLYIQNSTRPEDSIVIPHNQTDIENTKWTKGKCFYTMGLHYWYNLSEDIDCGTIFPVFLLYNGGRLNGFGFALTTSITSDRYEHPPLASIKLFMEVPPTCLATVGELTTMHVYLDSDPESNFC